MKDKKTKKKVQRGDLPCVPSPEMEDSTPSFRLLSTNHRSFALNKSCVRSTRVRPIGLCFVQASTGTVTQFAFGLIMFVCIPYIVQHAFDLSMVAR